jgi:tRNA A37 threonylcarbamoyladenosine dehydratase
MSVDFAQDYADRFGGLARLYGTLGLARLQSAHVCVIGVGGVGSWTVEALVRSGVGAVTLIDLDDVCITNVNRQLPAMDGAVGRPKINVLAERMELIHPGCRVTAVAEFVTEATLPRLLAGPFDCVIDAVDRTGIKTAVIAHCCRTGQPVVTVGGAGGRRDATAVRTADLALSQGDLLLKGVRKRLRRDHHFPKGEFQTFGVSAVFSAEPQVFPWSDGTCRAEAETGSTLRLDCAAGFGAAGFVTGTFGFAAAGEAVRLITSR